MTETLFVIGAAVTTAGCWNMLAARGTWQHHATWVAGSALGVAAMTVAIFGRAA